MRLRVDIEPWRMQDGSLEMRFEVTGREQHTWTQVVMQDELDSAWDLTWHCAEKLLREAMKKERASAGAMKP